MTSESGFDDLIGRRQFLARLSAAALFLGVHESPLGGSAPGAAEPETGAGRVDPGPRILSLELETAEPLDAMAAFYGDVLGLSVRRDEGGRLTVQAGQTTVTFVETTDAASTPFYHFAFNIPQSKILAAREWQLERTPLFVTPEGLRDPAFPDDVRHFRHWNAHSVFFWDPAGNVVEYIARHDLASPRDGGSGDAFTSHDILYASEVAFVADDVPRTGAALESAFGLPRYRNASEVFHATGDERGLLLIFGRGREIGDRLRGRPAPAGVFRTRARIRGSGPPSYGFDGYPYEIVTDRPG